MSAALKLMDISRVEFNACTSEGEAIYVDLPPEACYEKGPCGLLKQHMYGTRRAAEGKKRTAPPSSWKVFVQGELSGCVCSCTLAEATLLNRTTG